MPVALRDYQSTTTCVAESAESITRLLKSPNTGVPVNHTQNGAEQVLSGKILNGSLFCNNDAYQAAATHRSLCKHAACQHNTG
jgi:hypothetical protein